MKKFLSFLLFALSTNIAFAQSTTIGKIAIIHSPDHRPCTYFKIVGVTDADNTFNTPDPGDEEWFAVPFNRDATSSDSAFYGHDVAVDLVMLALLTNREVNVVTDPNNRLACGAFTQVRRVTISP